MQKQFNHPKEIINELRKIFISYHFFIKDTNMNGFGNIIIAADLEVYKDNLDKFILDLQKQISFMLCDMHKCKEVDVTVLFYR